MASGALRASTRHFVLKARAAAVALAFLALLPASEAYAGDVDTARQLFADGVKLFQRGDYEGARRLFKRAEAEHHAAPIVYNVALAEERTGHPQAAVEAYESYIAEKGDAGEFTPAAVVAIAQIKARSTRLRIESKPPGARLFVDASTLVEPSPTTLLVPAGHHVVVAQGEGWRGEQELETKGTGDALTIVIVPSAAPEPVAAMPAVPPVAAPVTPPVVAPSVAVSDVDHLPPVPETEGPDGFVWGASFALAPYHMQGAPAPGFGAQNGASATQAMAGGILEAGAALTDRFEVLARGFVAFGPNGKPTYAFMAGPAVSLRVASRLWLGATFIGGRLETRSNGSAYGTDLVFGAMAEVAVVILAAPYGQWTVGLQPGLLLSDDPMRNTAYLLPLTFGFRAY